MLTLKLLGIVLSIGVVALLSAAETALSYLARTRVAPFERDEDDLRADSLSRLLEKPALSLGSLLLLKTLAVVGTVVLSVAAAADLVGQGGGLLAVLVLTTLTLLVFAEFTPKGVASGHLESIGLAFARPVELVTTILYPLLSVLIFIANLLIRLVGGTVRKEGPFLTEEEIKSMFSVGEESGGVLEEDEREMIHSIFEFGDTIVREVMVPRTDMVCIPATATVDDALKPAIEKGFSRIPVYEGDLDHVVGVLYAKDLLQHLVTGKRTAKVRELVRPAYFVPETKKLDQLLGELRRKKTHIAVVVDEYGGTAGLVTIEDLLEEIVGEILDEYDVEERLVEHLSENTIRLDARLPLDEASELLGVELPDDDIDTIGGFVYNLVGKIPKEGESLEYDGLVFLMEKVQRHRIRKILVSKAEPAAPESEIIA